MKYTLLIISHPRAYSSIPDQMKCLADEFKKYMSRHEGCMLPSSMCFANLSREEFRPCNKTTKETMEYFHDFMKVIISQEKDIDTEVKDCHCKFNMLIVWCSKIIDSNPLPCSVNDPCQLVEIEVLEQEQMTMEDFKRLTVSYQPMSLMEEREDYMFSTNAFLSAVGGNLGLFLGFSILSCMFDLLGFVEKIWSGSFSI